MKLELNEMTFSGIENTSTEIFNLMFLDGKFALLLLHCKAVNKGRQLQVQYT